MLIKISCIRSLFDCNIVSMGNHSSTRSSHLPGRRHTTLSLASEDPEELSVTTTHILGLVMGLVNFWLRPASCCQNNSSIFMWKLQNPKVQCYARASLVGAGIALCKRLWVRITCAQGPLTVIELQ